MSLDEVRQEMRREAANAIDFSDPDVQEAYQGLADEFSASDREELVAIARGNSTEYSGSMTEQMRSWFEDKGIRGTYLDAWGDDTLRQIQYDIKQAFKDVWANRGDEIDDLRSTFRDADISKLNTMCAQGNYGQVWEELGTPDDLTMGRPDNFADCASVVAEAKDLSETISDMYDS
jgi:hypothetical protein